MMAKSLTLLMVAVLCCASWHQAEAGYVTPISCGHTCPPCSLTPSHQQCWRPTDSLLDIDILARVNGLFYKGCDEIASATIGATATLELCPLLDIDVDILGDLYLNICIGDGPGACSTYRWPQVNARAIAQLKLDLIAMLKVQLRAGLVIKVSSGFVTCDGRAHSSRQLILTCADSGVSGLLLIKARVGALVDLSVFLGLKGLLGGLLGK